jgi:hypothetical protein
MLQWWHKVCGKEKGKTMLLPTWLLFWYTPKEWAQKILEIDELLKMLYLVRGQVPTQVQMPML